MILSNQAKVFLQKIQLESDNNKCFQCNQIANQWVSANNAIFLCNKCATTHKSLGKNISYLKSISKDYWTSKQLYMMEKGGNNRFRLFLKDFEIPSDSDPNYKYKTIAAEYYRQKMLSLRIKIKFTSFLLIRSITYINTLINIINQQGELQCDVKILIRLQQNNNNSLIDQAKQMIMLGARKTKNFAMNTFETLENKYHQTDFKQIGRKSKEVTKKTFNKTLNGFTYILSLMKNQ